MPLLAVALSAPPARSEPAAAEIFTWRGADREQRLIEGAQKEGEVVISSALAPQTLRGIAEAFTRKYPFLKADYARADSGQIAQTIAEDAPANAVVPDVIEGSGIGRLPLSPKNFVPYDTPQLAAYPERYRDPNGLWTPTRLSYFGVVYNTGLVPPDKAPRTYEDLLDAQWKGKMAWRISSASGAPLFLTNLRLAWGEEKARAYFEKLQEQEISNFGSGSARTLVDRVIAGDYPIALNVFATPALISRMKGAAVDIRQLSPMASTAAIMVVPRAVRHPHAAMLLVDYILSHEGQQKLLEAGYYPARPDVRLPPALAPAVPADAGAEDFISPDVFIRYRESSEKLFEELFR